MTCKGWRVMRSLWSERLQQLFCSPRSKDINEGCHLIRLPQEFQASVRQISKCIKNFKELRKTSISKFHKFCENSGYVPKSLQHFLNIQSPVNKAVLVMFGREAKKTKETLPSNSKVLELEAISSTTILRYQLGAIPVSTIINICCKNQNLYFSHT